MKIPSPPICEGGNLVVELDKDDYRREIGDLKFSMVGKIFLKKGRSLLTVKELKRKLVESWGLENFKLIPMGGRHYNATLGNWMSNVES